MTTSAASSATAPAAIRAASLDNFTLAGELARHAAVTARHTSHAEFWQARGNERAAAAWVDSATRNEDEFLAELAEANRRLAGGDAELIRDLELYGATALLAGPPRAPQEPTA